MICPECKKLGLKSKIFIGLSYTTALNGSQFFDEEGRFHDHDPNTTTTSYSCSNGHSWIVKSNKKCWCGWPNNLKTAEEFIRLNSKDKKDVKNEETKESYKII